MRIWSLHPCLLDRRALVACWRETLLAQKVLRGLTRGYTNHTQLIRFRAHPQPLEAVAAYLSGLADEADARGYSFNRALIGAGEDDAGENNAGKNGTDKNCADKAEKPVRFGFAYSRSFGSVGVRARLSAAQGGWARPRVGASVERAPDGARRAGGVCASAV